MPKQRLIHIIRKQEKLFSLPIVKKLIDIGFTENDILEYSDRESINTMFNRMNLTVINKFRKHPRQTDNFYPLKSVSYFGN